MFATILSPPPLKINKNALVHEQFLIKYLVHSSIKSLDYLKNKQKRASLMEIKLSATSLIETGLSMNVQKGQRPFVVLDIFVGTTH